jgi:hypothetical protein
VPCPEEVYFLLGRTGIELRLNNQDPLADTLKDRLKDSKTYNLYEIKNEGEPEMVVEKWANFLAGGPECETGGCEIIKLTFNKKVEHGQSFMLTVVNYTDDDKRKIFPCEDKPRKIVSFKVNADAKIIRSLTASDPPSKLRVESKIPIEAKGEVDLKEETTRLRISPDEKKLEPAPSSVKSFKASAKQADDYSVDLDLKNGPAVGKSKLVLKGGLYEMPAPTNAGEQKSIEAQGEINVTSAPKPEDARLSATTSTVAGVHQKPVFDLVLKIVPFRVWTVRDTKWRWEPTLTADVGGGQTKSSNSVTVEPLTFIRDFVQGRTEVVDKTESEIPTYTGWRRTPLFRPSNYRLILGPKGEFDRSFKRKNLLGSARVNFEFHRWRGLIANRRAMLENDVPEKAPLVEGLDTGYDIVPYVAVEAGGHVNNETVAFNGVLNVFVPRHKIFRTYAGFNATFEQKLIHLPMTFTLDEALIYLGAAETIGFKTDTGVGLRRLKGFHHRSVVTWGIAFDPAKHFNFVVTYENGRKAPNLEYLNKLTTGFKVLF